MSKAFTREEDAGELVTRPIAPAGERRPVTPEGLARLHAQLDTLDAQIGAYRAQGLSDALPDLEVRRRQLGATLEALDVMQSGPDPEGRAVFGAWVTVEDEAGEVRTWRLVGPDEADAREGLLSVQSPLALALLGTRVGDTVEVERPRGDLELTVRDIRFEPPGPAGSPDR
jgi:transcription elongation factor GreB